MIAILTACYKRHDIFKLFLNSLPKDVYLICVGSEDENLTAFNDRKIKGTYLIHENKPLGKKWNAGLSYAKQIDFDYLLVSGSDDIFCQDLWAWYKTVSVHYAGLLDMYFMDYATGKVKYNEGFKAYRRGEPLFKGA